MLIYLRNIIQLILAPGRGWEDVSVSTDDTYHLIHKFLFPLFGITALTVLAQMVYHTEFKLVWSIVMAVIVFVSYFSTYFIATTMFKSYFYNFCDGTPNHNKCTTVIAYTLALLAISDIICNLMPVNLGLKYLLPLAVAMIMWKSNIYLHVKQDKDFLFIIFAILTTIAPPMVIQALFDIIL